MTKDRYTLRPAAGPNYFAVSLLREVTPPCEYEVTGRKGRPLKGE